MCDIIWKTTLQTFNIFYYLEIMSEIISTVEPNFMFFTKFSYVYFIISDSGIFYTGCHPQKLIGIRELEKQ